MTDNHVRALQSLIDAYLKNGIPVDDRTRKRLRNLSAARLDSLAEHWEFRAMQRLREEATGDGDPNYVPPAKLVKRFVKVNGCGGQPEKAFNRHARGLCSIALRDDGGEMS